MTIYSMSDPDFFTDDPDELREIQQLAKRGGLDVRHFIMGDPKLDTTPTAAILKMPPGYVLQRHAHLCERFEVIVSGSIQVGDQVLGAGHVMQSSYGEFYGPHVAGPDGCITVEFFSSIRANGNVVYEEESA